jgi:hypothetical protein
MNTIELTPAAKVLLPTRGSRTHCRPRAKREPWPTTVGRAELRCPALLYPGAGLPSNRTQSLPANPNGSSRTERQGAGDQRGPPGHHSRRARPGRHCPDGHRGHRLRPMSGPEPGTWSRGRDRGDLRAARGIRPWPGFGHRARRRICRVWRPRPGRRGRRVRRAGGRSRVRRKRLGFSLRRNSHGLPLKSGLTPEGDSKLRPASFEGQVCCVSVLLPAQKGRHQSQHRDVRCGYRSLRAGADAILRGRQVHGNHGPGKVPGPLRRGAADSNAGSRTAQSVAGFRPRCDPALLRLLGQLSSGSRSGRGRTSWRRRRRIRRSPSAPPPGGWPWR